MSRRPSIESTKIKEKYRPDVGTSDNPITFFDNQNEGGSFANYNAEGPLRGGNDREVIGMSNGCDFSRCKCRGCDTKIITRKNPPKKGTRYFRCRKCNTWHHLHSGFFDQERFKTKPLKQEEFSEELFKVKLEYKLSNFEQFTWFYGSEEFINKKINSDNYQVIESKVLVD